MEAQRYPGDFAGIAAGAPANNMVVQNTFHHAWNVLTLGTGSRSCCPHAPMQPSPD
ncbi:hypothetical protein [Streptomyces cupreus]|uniref:hypothetical protein n=1 Tax=Streptomyces cupreus TaxID=2759956 RepID=UPI00300D3B64